MVVYKQLHTFVIFFTRMDLFMSQKIDNLKKLFIISLIFEKLFLEKICWKICVRCVYYENQIGFISLSPSFAGGGAA